MRAVACAAALAAVLTPVAYAEDPLTSESVAYGLDWIARVPDARFGAPATRPVICEIDTGTAITPDTPATSPAGPIIARLSVFSQDPLAGDQTAMVHGTRMAAAIAAPRNGWGIVGISPSARIVSVKVTTSDVIDSAAVTRGITLCRQWSAANAIPVAAVLLALGAHGTDPAQGARMTEYVAQLNADGASAVAAAGNTAGEGTQWPASTPGAIAVGAGTAGGGAWCPFASHDNLTAIAAPGCDVSAAADDGTTAIWPEGGSSNAAAVTAGVLAALRALRPDAPRATAEKWLAAGTTILDGAHQLDGRAIATAAGLTDLLTPTPTPTPATTATPTTPTTQAAAAPTTAVMPPVTAALQLAAPKQIHARIARRALLVSVSAGVKGQRLQVAIRSGNTWRYGTGTRSAVLKQVHSVPARVWVRWIASGVQRSDWVPMKRPAAHPSVRAWHASTSHEPIPPR